MTVTTNHLSLASAILININVMLGTGLFINTTELAKRAGSWSTLSYLFIGILMLPLILCMSELLKKYPSGGFYSFAKPIHPYAGFLSAWIYFTAKLASATLMINTAMTLIQAIIIPLQAYNILYLDILVLTIFVVLNLCNIQTGSFIQKGFVIGKIIPIAFLGGAALLIFNKHNLIATTHHWSTLISTLPLVLYATIGFEAACSLSSRIKDPAKNAPKALLISYGLAIGLVSLYQLMFYGVLGDTLATMDNVTKPFPALVALLPSPFSTVSTLLTTILHLGIATSALGGSYGILFSNSWNLYTLAINNHLFYAKTIASLNRYATPWLCVLIEGIICCGYLYLTNGQQVTLQQLSALGCIMAYFISVISLYMINDNQRSCGWQWLIRLGVINCAALIINVTYALAHNSSYALYVFMGLVITGSIMFFTMHHLTKKHTNT